MKVLVLNCGSSSIKYQLFDMPTRTLLAKGIVERIGEAQAAMIHQEGSDKQQQRIAAADHEQAMAAILATLMHAEGGKHSNESPIGAVGHRVVHGGEAFTGSVLIDDAVIASIDSRNTSHPSGGSASSTVPRDTG